MDTLSLLSLLIHVGYMAAAAAFILSLKWMSAVPTARRGVKVGILGMVLAVGAALLSLHVHQLHHPTQVVVTYKWILVAFAIGIFVGYPMANIAMTAVPQRTALSHAFGALAAALVGTAEFSLMIADPAHPPTRFTMFALVLEVLLGFLTFTASLMAFGKPQELIPTRPMTFPGQNLFNFGIIALSAILGFMIVRDPNSPWLFALMSLLALTFGVMLIVPIGGADMPTVIALLNSYAGLSAAMMGFVLDNKLLIIAGSLDGSSGFILAVIMCNAMNRSFSNVLFGAFGQVQVSAAKAGEKNYRSASAEEAASILEAAHSVIVIPGYGMAVSQAQHKVRELADALGKRGVSVKFAIHPVAGRMPGHMNVLLAEANVSYEKLIEMDEANSEFPQCDVALVIGANDVVNPGARTDEGSPIYGMPILDADKARTVMIIKRSMNPGFAGIDNELYYLDKSLMLFGDAKGFVADMVKELSGGGTSFH